MRNIQNKFVKRYPQILIRVLAHIHIPHTPRVVLPTPPAKQLNNTDLNTPKRHIEALWAWLTAFHKQHALQYPLDAQRLILGWGHVSPTSDLTAHAQCDHV